MTTADSMVAMTIMALTATTRVSVAMVIILWSLCPPWRVYCPMWCVQSLRLWLIIAIMRIAMAAVHAAALHSIIPVATAFDVVCRS